MTANVLAGEREKCLNVGMDDYLQKPVQLESLIKLINKWLPEKQQCLKDETPEVKKEATQNNCLKNNANKLHMEYDLYQELLNDFYREHQQTVEEIKGLLVNNKYKSAVLYLHRLKGTAGNLGFQTIFDIGTLVEQKILTQASEQALLESFTEFTNETNAVMKIISKENNKSLINKAKPQVEHREAHQLNVLLSQLGTHLLTHNYAAKKDYQNLSHLLQASEYSPIMQQIESSINQLNYQQA